MFCMKLIYRVIWHHRHLGTKSVCIDHLGHIARNMSVGTRDETCEKYGLVVGKSFVRRYPGGLGRREVRNDLHH